MRRVGEYTSFARPRFRQFSETDFTDDLRKIDVPTLIAHGDDDQIVPIATSALISAKLVGGAVLKVYPGGPHGLAATRVDEFNADLLAFLQAGARRASTPVETHARH